MFQSNYIPEYFSLKQLTQLRQYNNTNNEELSKNEINNNNGLINKYMYGVKQCSVL
jgi:hypothetical protein